MNEPIALFLTVFGLGGLPIAIGFLLATRGAAPRPSLAPWRAGYGCFALGFLTALPAAQENLQSAFLPMAHVAFLFGAGLHTLGWVRLWRGPTALAFTALPSVLYGALYAAWGRTGGPQRLAALFSILFALTSAVAILGAHRGLASRRPNLRAPATLLIALNTLFWTGRSVHLLVTGSGWNILYSFTVAALEYTLYLGLMAFLQWNLVME